jgi:hypothetical protein
VTACGQSKEIPCWVSRPWEKSLFVLYMSLFYAVFKANFFETGGMALISIIISVAEFIYMSSHMGAKGYKVLDNSMNSTILLFYILFIQI